MTIPILKHSAALLAVAAGGVFAAAVPGSTAVAFLSAPDTYELHVQSPATLQARGAAVSVPVQVTCPQGNGFTVIDLTLTQRAGNTVVGGSRSLTLTCTGQPQVVVVNIVTQVGSKPFKTGQGFVEADLFACGYTCGTTATDSRAIQIQK